MSKAGESILRGLQDAVAFLNGDHSRARVSYVLVPSGIDVKRMRHRLGFTQQQFASTFGFSVSSVRDWEHGRHMPRHIAITLLTVIDREPEAVLRALKAS